mgnify:CR=1 FL=1
MVSCEVAGDSEAIHLRLGVQVLVLSSSGFPKVINERRGDKDICGSVKRLQRGVGEACEGNGERCGDEPRSHCKELW